jgi:hypothetical protein
MEEGVREYAFTIKLRILAEDQDEARARLERQVRHVSYQLIDTEVRVLRTCPDKGTCHHECGAGPCFRVSWAGPLSGVYPGDAWPAEVIAEQAGRETSSADRGHL